MKTKEQLADEHIEWLIQFIVPIIRKIGREEFLHGYKHGRDDREELDKRDNLK